jgi:HAE1 family hydrophobic/amphiphilic exporter-1
MKFAIKFFQSAFYLQCALLFGSFTAFAQMTPNIESFPPGVVHINETSAVNQSNATERIETVGFSLSVAHPLSLREAIEMALVNNADVKLVQKNGQLAQCDLRAAYGDYDARIAFSSRFERELTPGTNIFNSGSNAISILTRNQINAVRVEKNLSRWGSILNGEFSAIRNFSTDPFNTFRASTLTSLTFSLTQPLGRGRNFDATRRRIEIARRNLTVTDYEFRQRAIETVAAVQRAYWDLAFALKNLQVQQEALQNTEAQRAHIERLIAEGKLAPAETLAVEAEIAQFNKERLTAVAGVVHAENELKKLIAAPEDEKFLRHALLPTDDIHLASPTIVLDEAVKTAMENRLEIQRQNIAQEINGIERRFAREEVKPQIDVTASYGLNGFAGRPAPTILGHLDGDAARSPAPPQLLTGGYGQSLNNLFRNRFNTFRVGVSVSLPLRNSAAKAELSRTTLEAEKLEIEKRKTLQIIRIEVESALQEVRTAEAKLKAAEIASIAFAKSLESERRKLDAGSAAASISLVLEKRTRLAQALASEVQIRIELNKAIGELQRVTGTTLKQSGIDIQNAPMTPNYP